jgi:protein arginine kinase activator
LTCEECNERDATVRFAEMTDGELASWNLCEECARKRGWTASLMPFAGPLVSILMGLLEEAGERGPDLSGPVCSRCGLSFAEFRSSGKLGCGACYASFHSELKPLLRRVHGTTEHTGGVPSCREREFDSLKEVKRLRSELDRAVRNEEYERAAELRDRIRAKERELASTAGEGAPGTAGGDGNGEDVDVRDDDA